MKKLFNTFLALMIGSSVTLGVGTNIVTFSLQTFVGTATDRTLIIKPIGAPWFADTNIIYADNVTNKTSGGTTWTNLYAGPYTINFSGLQGTVIIDVTNSATAQDAAGIARRTPASAPAIRYYSATEVDALLIAIPTNSTFSTNFPGIIVTNTAQIGTGSNAVTIEATSDGSGTADLGDATWIARTFISTTNNTDVLNIGASATLGGVTITEWPASSVITPSAPLPPPLQDTVTNSTYARLGYATWSTNMGRLSSLSVPVGLEQRAKVSGDVLLVGQSTNLSIISVTNRSLPTLAASLVLSSNIHAIESLGSIFYVGGDQLLKVYNCGVPKSPVLVTNLDLGTNVVKKMTVADGYLFATCYSPGVTKIYSLANPALPQLISTLAAGSGDVAKRGNYLYLADYLGKTIKVADFTDPFAPVIVHSQNATNHGDNATFEPWRIITKDNALYVLDDNTFQIFSLNNPTNPVFVSAFQSDPDVEGAKLVGDLLLWSSSAIDDETSAEIIAYDVQDAFNPSVFARTNTGWSLAQLWFDVDNRYIYHPSSSAINILNLPRLTRADNNSTLLVGIANSVRLPPASNHLGRIFTFRCISNVTAQVSTTGSDLIDSDTTYPMLNGEAVWLQSDGINKWFSVAKISNPALPGGTNMLDAIGFELWGAADTVKMRVPFGDGDPVEFPDGITGDFKAPVVTNGGLAISVILTNAIFRKEAIIEGTNTTFTIKGREEGVITNNVLTISGAGDITVLGTAFAASFSGGGSALTALNANNITSGTLGAARVGNTNNITDQMTFRIVAYLGTNAIFTNLIPASLLTGASATNLTIQGPFTYGANTNLGSLAMVHPNGTTNSAGRYDSNRVELVGTGAKLVVGGATLDNPVGSPTVLQPSGGLFLPDNLRFQVAYNSVVDYRGGATVSSGASVGTEMATNTLAGHYLQVGLSGNKSNVTNDSRLRPLVASNLVSFAGITQQQREFTNIFNITAVTNGMMPYGGTIALSNLTWLKVMWSNGVVTINPL